jgi:hypothetical protein
MKIELSRKLAAELVETQGTEKVLFNHEIDLMDLLDNFMFESNNSFRSRAWCHIADDDMNPMRVLRINKIRVSDETGTHDESDGQFYKRHCAYLQLLSSHIESSDLDPDIKKVFEDGYASVEAYFRRQATMWFNEQERKAKEAEEEAMATMRDRVQRRKEADAMEKKGPPNSNNDPYSLI